MLSQSSKLFIVLTAAALYFLPLQSAAAESMVVEGRLESDTVWSGEVFVQKTVTVPEWTSLRIEPGTRVRFAPDTGLHVNGELVVDGSKEHPVLLAPKEIPADGAPPEKRWSGIRIQNAKPSRIGYTKVVGAGWTEVIGSAVKVHDSVFEKGLGGIKFTVGGRSLVTNVDFFKMAEGGVNISTGAAAEIFDSNFSQCALYGAINGQRGLMRVRGCEFDNCEVGVKVINDGSGVKENSFKDCQVAIIVLQSTGKFEILNNRISGGDVGILCNQFASPKVIANEIRGAKEGIRCYQGSSPLLAHNLIEECETGISCIQLCKPLIEKNLLVRNKVGIYLQTSSYAIARNNNFVGDGMHLKLGNMMSSDWEKRVTEKPKRALQARNDELVKLGRAVAEKLETKVVASGEVDARSNWWGIKAAAEMDEKGKDAEIAVLHDSFDTGRVSYKGYEGDYALDRVVYAEWLKAPVEDAGPAGFKPPESPKGSQQEGAKQEGANKEVPAKQQ